MGDGMFDGIGCLAAIGMVAVILFVIVALPLAGWWIWNHVQVVIR